MLSELKRFKLEAKLVLEYKKRNKSKIFHWSAKLVSIDSDIEEAFKLIYQCIMMKIKNSADEDWVVIETIVLRIFSVSIRKEKWK